MKTSNEKNMKDKELLELGKKIQMFYDMGYINKKQALTFSFLKGIATGAGAFIGGTLVIGILLWVLSLFDNLPLIDAFVKSVQDSLKK